MPRKRQENTRNQAQESDGEARTSGPRPFWSGTITFGLVSLPVGLYPANRSKPVSLRMIDQDGTPLARRYFCEKERRTLRGDELIRGYEVEKNEFIVVEDRELDELAPEKSQEIDLKRFVALSEIDPMYFERAYFLTPEKGITKAYRLLAKSMEDSARAGIATFVMRGKEYLVAVIAEKGILRAETLRFHAEVREPESVGLPEAESPHDDRVRSFEKAIDSLYVDTLDRRLLEDSHSQKIIERVNEKLEKGEGVIGLPDENEDELEQGGDVVDLMQVLKQSLEQGETPSRASTASEPAKHRTGKRKQPGSDRRAHGKERPARREAQSSDLSRLSRNELYQRAQELDIPGRSNMSKEQLIDAIEHAA